MAHLGHPLIYLGSRRPWNALNGRLSETRGEVSVNTRYFLKYFIFLWKGICFKPKGTFSLPSLQAIKSTNQKKLRMSQTYTNRMKYLSWLYCFRSKGETHHLPYEDVFPPAGLFWQCHKFLGLSRWSSHPLAYGFSLIGILGCPPEDHSLRCCYCWPNCWMQCRSDQGSLGGPSNRRGERWEWSPHFQVCTEKLTHSNAP